MTQITGLSPDQMITALGTMVGDTLEPTLAYQFLNLEKDSVEADDNWAILNGLDESQSAVAGDTYLTTHALPTDFGEPNPGGIFVGSDHTPYLEVDFDDRIKYQTATHRYYIDYANNVFALCGVAGSGGTIHFPYRKSSPVLVAGGSSWIFPGRFHMLLPILVAVKYFPVDQGNKGFAWDDRWDAHADKLLSTMRRWNARLLLQGSQNGTLQIDQSSNPLVVDIDGTGNGILYG